MHKYLLTFCLLLLVGCASWDARLNHDNEYLQSQRVNALAIPSGIDAMPLQNDYPVPNGEVSSKGTSPSLLPPGSLAERLAAQKT